MSITTRNPQLDAKFSFRALEIATGHMTAREYARIIGVTMRTIQRWRATGIPADRADNIAVALHEHPGLVWPDQWWGSANG